MLYINRKDCDTRQIETIECKSSTESRRDFRKLLEEYRTSDYRGDYYISQRATKQHYTEVIK